MERELFVKRRYKGKVTLNIGGRIFRTRTDTLRRLNNTKLGRLTERSPEYDPAENEYYFDRNPLIFDNILDIYRTGEAHFQQGMCGAYIKQELEFWEISDEYVSDCCWRVYFQHEEEKEKRAALDALLTQYQNEGSGGDRKETFSRWRVKLMQFLEDPTSSKLAMAWGIFYLVLVLASVTVQCMSTHPAFRFVLPTPRWNVSVIENAKLRMFLATDLYYELWYLEAVCLLIFTTELIVRLIFSLNKWAFVKSAYNIIDLLAILPGLGMLVLEITNHSFMSSGALFNAAFYLTLLGVFRIFRLIKFARHYTAMRVLLLALRASIREILLLLMLIAMGMLIFSTLIYFAEFYHVTSDIDTIPYGFWWSIVTMTTVGYGDARPKTSWGYVVGGLCALAGMLSTGLPIPIIASNFNLHFSYYRENARLQKRKDRMSDAYAEHKPLPSISGAVDDAENTKPPTAKAENATRTSKRRRKRRTGDLGSDLPVTQPVYVRNATFLGNNIRTYTNYASHDGSVRISSSMTSSDDDDDVTHPRPWRTPEAARDRSDDRKYYGRVDPVEFGRQRSAPDVRSSVFTRRQSVMSADNAVFR